MVSIPFGMVSLSSVGQAKMFQLPQFMHFGIHFEISACVAIGLLFAINSVQAIGDYSATTIGAMDREPEDRELQNGITAYGVTNIIGALLGGLPTATYSQNVGIVTTTKVINRWVLGLAAVILGVAGIVPKFSALLTTIPQCVLDGFCICFDRHDRNEAGSVRRDGLPKFLNRWSCGSNRCGCFTGIRGTCKFSGVGNNDFW